MLMVQANVRSCLCLISSPIKGVFVVSRERGGALSLSCRSRGYVVLETHVVTRCRVIVYYCNYRFTTAMHFIIVNTLLYIYVYICILHYLVYIYLCEMVNRYVLRVYCLVCIIVQTLLADKYIYMTINYS